MLVVFFRSFVCPYSNCLYNTVQSQERALVGKVDERANVLKRRRSVVVVVAVGVIYQ